MILGFLQHVLPWILPILVVLTLVITIHELGHFLVARAFGVAVDRFSLGFGKPIVRWRSKSGMEWTIGWIPLGGFVKFSGDESIASVPDAEDLAALRKAVVARDGPAALNRYFHFKPLWQRALVVAAGPFANFVLAVVIFTALAWAFGVLVVAPKIYHVVPQSPAAQAGFLPGDTIRVVDGRHVRSIEDVMMYVLLRPGERMQFEVDRGGRAVAIVATPRRAVTKDPTTGTPMTGGQLGVQFGVDRSTVKRERFGPIGALGEGVRETASIIDGSVAYLTRIVSGRANGQQLRGTIGTAGIARSVTTDVIAAAPNVRVMIEELCLQLLRFSAYLSVAVGFANLLPIPVLDGGHLLFYAYEGVARRPVAARVQDVGYRVGFAMIIALVLFTTWNDLNRYRVFQFIGGLFSVSFRFNMADFMIPASTCVSARSARPAKAIRGRRFGVSSALALAAAGVLGAPAWAQTAPAGSDVGAINVGPATGAAGLPATSTPATAAPTATADEPVASAGAAPQAVVIQRILVEGNERIERATVISYLPIHIGDAADPGKIDLALKTLFRTDLFSDVNITVQGSDLVVKIVENPIINQVVFEGNKALKEDKLRDEVTVRPRAIFTRAKVEQDVQRIVELYRRSGKISATVTPKIVQLPQKRVDLIFEIDEGPKSGILRVNFTGNKAFSDNDLRGVIVTKESAWYRLFSSNDNYDPDRIEYDKEQLRKYYRNRGYYDFRVISSVAELASEKNGFALTYAIEEGPKYTFGKVTVETQLKRLDPKLLQQLLPVHEGEVYSDEKIEKATDALTFAAGASGFAFVDVRPHYTSHADTKTVDLTFDLKEGPRVYVERIDIVGNTRTLDYVIRREMNVSEGDAYNRVLVERSKMNIRGLGFFKDVDIQQVPGSAADKVVLQVKISEQPTGTFSFSVGYSSVDAIVGDVGVTEQNFRGRGQQVSLRLSAGSYRQQVDFSFTEPRFGGRNMAAGFDLFAYRFDLTNQAAFVTSSIGGIARVGFPLSDQVRFNPRYTLKYDTISVADYLCTPQFDANTGTFNTLIAQSTCDARGGALTSSVGYTVRWDRRNDYINPTRGFFIQLDQDFAGLGGDVRYVKTQANGAWYYGFNPKWIVSIIGSAGYVDGWGGDDVRINDRFFKGGTTFRGFDIAGIGPRQVILDPVTHAIVPGSNGTSLGGKLYAIGTAELAFPTPLPDQYGIKMALFTDWGTLGLLDHNDKTLANGLLDSTIRDDLKLRASAGVSIFWRSPMGPLRFDLSHVFLKTPYDNTQVFRFSTATRF